MLFNSIPFIIFFPLVVILYYLIPVRFRYIWLLVCSYIFYFSQSSSYVVFLLLSTISTYLAGIGINKCESAKTKKIIVAVVVFLNIGILFVIKYTNFILEIAGSSNRYNLILPIGISFYTFQALSYVIDLYRGKIKPMLNPIKYALYVSFFLSLLSGPINRAQDFLGELNCDKELDLARVKNGMQRMLWGYFLKLVIAARLSILVDTVYADPDSLGGVSLLLGAICFLFMLYCDFEGYSLIAIGAADILGIRMRDNFRQPFYSASISELWSRWHISLTTWFREYLYFPLGGNRKGVIRRYINMSIVFLVSGIWHGANFTFFIWGLLNGFFLVMGNALVDIRENIAVKTGFAKYDRLRLALKRIGVYALYGFSMIFFRSDNVQCAFKVISGIIFRFNIMRIPEVFSLGLGVGNLILVFFLAVIVMLVDKKCYDNRWSICDLFADANTIKRWVAYLLIVVAILFSANLTGKEFIYSQM